ncbi:MAG: response regulator [Roseiflexaceae bacterium]
MSDKIKVLLVDDHVVFRRGMQRLLRCYDDFEVVGEAGTGEEALRVVVDAVPDVVLMDIDMPGEGGIAATAAIRAHSRRCRVVLLTGYRHYVAVGFQAGASGYVLKQADEDVLVEAIHVVYSGGVYLQPELQDEAVEGLQHGTAAALSEREIAILRLVAQGASNRAIGSALGLSEVRIKQQLSTILDKLGAQDRAHAVALSIRRGLV